MKKLILIRHAKSSWEASLSDFDRPLTSRGISDAKMISKQLVRLLPKTYTCFSSTARRAAETAAIFTKELNSPFDRINFDNALYTFEETQLANFIKELDNTLENVILFGHNDAITNFVNKFGSTYIDQVPTSGVVALAFEVHSWQQISKGMTQNFIFPSEFR